MPWKKGQSGNPSGARKRIPHWVAEFRRMEPAAFKRITAILDGTETTTPKEFLEAFKLAMAYSRGAPRASSTVEVSGPGGGPIETTHDGPPRIDAATLANALALLRGGDRASGEQRGEPVGAAGDPPDGPTDGTPPR